jgi:hypothetical protein
MKSTSSDVDVCGDKNSHTSHELSFLRFVGADVKSRTSLFFLLIRSIFCRNVATMRARGESIVSEKT